MVMDDKTTTLTEKHVAQEKDLLARVFEERAGEGMSQGFIAGDIRNFRYQAYDHEGQIVEDGGEIGKHASYMRYQNNSLDRYSIQDAYTGESKALLEYDENGNLKGARFYSSRTDYEDWTFERDENGDVVDFIRQSKAYDKNTAQWVEKSTRHHIDEDGQHIETVYADEAQTKPLRKITYDSFNMPKSIKVYDADGKMTLNFGCRDGKPVSLDYNENGIREPDGHLKTQTSRTRFKDGKPHLFEVTSNEMGNIYGYEFGQENAVAGLKSGLRKVVRCHLSRIAYEQNITPHSRIGQILKNASENMQQASGDEKNLAMKRMQEIGGR